MLLVASEGHLAAGCGSYHLEAFHDADEAAWGPLLDVNVQGAYEEALADPYDAPFLVHSADQAIIWHLIYRAIRYECRTSRAWFNNYFCQHKSLLQFGHT